MPTSLDSAPVLVFEAATSAGSVAVIRPRHRGQGEVLAACDVVMGVGREDQLFPAVRAVLDEAGVGGRELAGVVCGRGPGSFTSLRIAAALAKGFAVGFDVPLYAVSSLLLAAAAVPDDLAAGALDGRWLLHADALRGERYVLPVQRAADGLVRPAGPVQRVLADALDAAADGAVLIAVRGARAVAEVEEASVAATVSPVAGALARVARDVWCVPVELDTWEPEYGRLAEAQVKWEVAHQMALPMALQPSAPSREDSPS